jgi:hypothetical protein
MIFGFNTDITAKQTVYHVQTEVREQQPRLESQIFVRGICVGKRATDLPEVVSEEEIQQLARTQHRLIVEAVRSGSMKLVDPARQGLRVEFLGPRHLGHDKTILRFRVLFNGDAAPSAKVAVNWKIGSESGVLDERMTDEAGVVEMRLYAADATVEMEMRVRLGSRAAKRRFLIKPSMAESDPEPEIERWG